MTEELKDIEEEAEFDKFMCQFNDYAFYLVRKTFFQGGKTKVGYDIMFGDDYDYCNNEIQMHDCKNGVSVGKMKMVINGSNWYHKNGEFGDTDSITYDFKEIDLEKVWKTFC